MREPSHVVRRSGVPGVHDRTAGPRGAHHVRGMNDPVADVHRFPGLEATEVRTVNAERARENGIEAPSLRPFVDPVGERGDGVFGVRGADRVALELHRLSRREGVHLDRKPEGVVPHGERAGDHLLRVRGTVDVERLRPMVEAHALDEPGEAQEVVAVEMGQEDPSDAHERRGRVEELTLRALPAVEEEQLPLEVQRDRARRAVLGRPRPGGPEEGDAHRGGHLVAGKSERGEARPRPGSRG